MPKRYLITGCSGFIGYHLACLLVHEGQEVFGTYHRNVFSIEGVEASPCDFRNHESVQRLIKQVSPDVVFHLAGQTNIPASWKDFEGTFAANVSGTYYLLESLREMNLKARVVVAGSSSEYGPVKDRNLFLQEESPFRPMNPYALSKVAEDLLGELYYRTFNLAVLRVRPFYVIGPRKEPDAPSDFAKAIVRHRRGEGEHLSVGNLNVLRDVVDIRDAVKALLLLAEKGEVGGVYNLCTGKETALKKILEELLRISQSTLPVVQDPAKFRVGDETRIVGDPVRLRKLGWQPSFSLEETLQSILDYWSSQA